jgi:hypothetical protein
LDRDSEDRHPVKQFSFVRCEREFDAKIFTHHDVDDVVDVARDQVQGGRIVRVENPRFPLCLLNYRRLCV